MQKESGSKPQGKHITRSESSARREGGMVIEEKLVWLWEQRTNEWMMEQLTRNMKCFLCKSKKLARDDYSWKSECNGRRRAVKTKSGTNYSSTGGSLEPLPIR
jgi:hypothetical protein